MGFYEWSQYHEGTEIGYDLWRSSCLSRATYSSFPRTMSRWLLSVFKDVDYTACLGNLCSVTLTMKKCFQMSRGNLLCFRFCLLLLSLVTAKKSLAPSSLHPPFRCVHTHTHIFINIDLFLQSYSTVS